MFPPESVTPPIERATTYGEETATSDATAPGEEIAPEMERWKRVQGKIWKKENSVTSFQVILKKAIFFHIVKM